MKSFILTIFLFFFLVSNSQSNPIVTGIEDNWNEIKSMSGQFEQIDQEGNIFSGHFYFLKPYKSKFTYDGREEDIITNKSLMVVVDKEGYQIDSYLIGNHIMKSLLSDKTNISKIVKKRYNEILNKNSSQNIIGSSCGIFG